MPSKNFNKINIHRSKKLMIILNFLKHIYTSKHNFLLGYLYIYYYLIIKGAMD